MARQLVVLLLGIASLRALVPDSEASRLRALLNPRSVHAIESINTTRRGERMRTVLPDDSLIDQNTETVVRSAMSERQRELTLSHGGEVVVNVAGRRHVPFVIHADDLAIRTNHGTLWVKSTRPNVWSVGVLADTAEVHRDSDGMGVVNLRAGDIVTFSVGSIRFEPDSLQDLTRQTAWRRSEIWLSGQTLEDAAVEFNRYSDRKLVIKDRRTAALRLSGRFFADDVDKFVRALKPLRVRARRLEHAPRSQEVILLSRL